MDAALIAAADRLSRSWHGGPGRIRIGSEAHERLFCGMLLDTFNPYKPSIIDWPQLPDDARMRLTGLPIWEGSRLARDIGGNRDDNNFTVTGGKSIGIDLGPGESMDLCLAENGRRLAGYDRRLLRPATVPWLVRLARRTLLHPKRTPVSAGDCPR